MKKAKLHLYTSLWSAAVIEVTIIIDQILKYVSWVMCPALIQGRWDNATEAEKGWRRRKIRPEVQVGQRVPPKTNSTQAFQQHPMLSIYLRFFENGSVIFV